MFWCQRLWYILYVTCWIAKKRGGVLNWPLLSKLQRTAKSNKPKTTDKMNVRFCFEFVFTFILRIYASVSNKRRAGWMCKSSPARFRLQNYYFFLNCANILRRKRYSAPSPFITILVNRGIWCYDSIYTAELIIYHSASAISATTIKIIIISSIIINFKG